VSRKRLEKKKKNNPETLKVEQRGRKSTLAWNRKHCCRGKNEGKREKERREKPGKHE
jgi:hypothetical protein